MHFHLRGCHALWPAFPDRSINTPLSLCLTNRGLPYRSLTVTAQKTPVDYCGPATPHSPFESHGLGYSEFARHYYRNHGCFIFLRVLRWFTSPGSLRHPMYSDDGCQCSHRQGFPIRTSPDHSLLATPRSLSQLTTSFIAYLRQGIHTHALSSLTIKSTSHTTRPYLPAKTAPAFRACERYFLHARTSGKKPPMLTLTCVLLMPVKYSVVKDQFPENPGVRIQESECETI